MDLASLQQLPAAPACTCQGAGACLYCAQQLLAQALKVAAAAACTCGKCTGCIARATGISPSDYETITAYSKCGGVGGFMHKTAARTDADVAALVECMRRVTLCLEAKGFRIPKQCAGKIARGMANALYALRAENAPSVSKLSLASVVSVAAEYFYSAASNYMHALETRGSPSADRSLAVYDASVPAAYDVPETVMDDLNVLIKDALGINTQVITRNGAKTVPPAGVSPLLDIQTMLHLVEAMPAYDAGLGDRNCGMYGTPLFYHYEAEAVLQTYFGELSGEDKAQVRDRADGHGYLTPASGPWDHCKWRMGAMVFFALSEAQQAEYVRSHWPVVRMSPHPTPTPASTAVTSDEPPAKRRRASDEEGVDHRFWSFRRFHQSYMYSLVEACLPLWISQTLTAPAAVGTGTEETVATFIDGLRLYDAFVTQPYYATAERIDAATLSAIKDFLDVHRECKAMTMWPASTSDDNTAVEVGEWLAKHS
jgi:hypothetical protein